MARAIAAIVYRGGVEGDYRGYSLLFGKSLLELFWQGVIAQLIRALPLQGRGPGFESQLLHQFVARIVHLGTFRRSLG